MDQFFAGPVRTMRPRGPRLRDTGSAPGLPQAMERGLLDWVGSYRRRDKEPGG